MLVLAIVFWSCAGLIAYSYIGYPVVLFLLATVVQRVRDFRYIVFRGERRSRPDAAELPAVTMVVAAYNEEEVIREKIENTFALDYPKDKLEVLIGSDGSSDRTNEIVREYAGRGITLIAYPERRGKATVVNETVPRARHDIIVMSDANTMYEPRAIRHLVKYFPNKKVGAVIGEMVLHSIGDQHKGEMHYWRYEVILKFMENKLHAILGANGGLYAMRKELFEPIPPDTLNDDFVIPLRIAARGYRQIYSPEARAHEATAKDLKAEAIRKSRIAAGNFQSIFRMWWLLNPFKHFWIAFTFFSHKVIRWLAPLFMFGALAANAALATSCTLYAILFGLQAAFYGIALVGSVAGGIPVVHKLCAVPYYFVSMNVAMMRGFVRCVRHSQSNKWKKIERK